MTTLTTPIERIYLWPRSSSSSRRGSRLKLLACLAAALGPALAATSVAAQEAEPEPAAETYLLRYKFKPGEKLRWKVEHRAQVRATVGGTTQTTENFSGSIKVWKVLRTDANKTTFAYSVESVQMNQQLTGRQEVSYDSTTDATAPPGFETVAQSIGVVLSEITLDERGKIIERAQKHTQQGPTQDSITLPMPEEAVAIGSSWHEPSEVKLTRKDGSTRAVKLDQEFTLESVKSGVATITVETHVLSPIRNAPDLQAQLVQQMSHGTVRFDVKAGRILSQQTELDEKVHSFQGEGSLLHYAMRFEEELLSPSDRTVRRQGPVVAPATPPRPATKKK